MTEDKPKKKYEKILAHELREGDQIKMGVSWYRITSVGRIVVFCTKNRWQFKDNKSKFRRKLKKAELSEA